jgi:hypothetical protein
LSWALLYQFLNSKSAEHSWVFFDQNPAIASFRNSQINTENVQNYFLFYIPFLKPLILAKAKREQNQQDIRRYEHEPP